MKRLIRECFACDGSGTTHLGVCGACEGRGQTGEDVRVVSLNLSDKRLRAVKPLPTANLLSKWFDSTATPTVMGCGGSTGTVGVTPFAPISTAISAVLNQVPQGLLVSQRIGRSLSMKRLYLRFCFEIGATAFYTYSVKIAVVYQRYCAGSTTMPLQTAIWSAAHFLSFQNIGTMSEFEILFEKVVDLSGNYGVGTITLASKSVVTTDVTLDLEGRLTSWVNSDTTGIFTNMTTGALMLYCIGSAPPANQPELIVQTRLEYCDD